jgi:hypothetical protein
VEKIYVWLNVCFFFFLLLLSWRIRLSRLFRFRIKSYESGNLINSKYDSLHKVSAHRKAATYTGQHYIQKKCRQALMPGVVAELMIPVFHRGRHFLPETEQPLWLAPHVLTYKVFAFCPQNVLSRDRVTIDGVCISNWIYWTFADPWLQLIIIVSIIHILYSSLEHT